MIPSNFEQSNIIMDTPKDVDPDDVQPVYAFKGATDDGTPVIITCWRPTQHELEQLKKTGRCWLTLMGTSMPPAFISSEDPFK